MRSTAEWEAALDGTTEGKWIQAQGVEVWAEGDNGVNLYVGSAYRHNGSLEDNARLFALAPEAVAEVVRLRRELETLRRDMRHQPSNTLAADVGNAITIILEGTNE
jgi:hypothetical protein